MRLTTIPVPADALSDGLSELAQMAVQGRDKAGAKLLADLASVGSGVSGTTAVDLPR